MTETAPSRDPAEELVARYPDLALLLRRAATLHTWQPSAVGERVLQRLARALAEVLQADLSTDAAAERVSAVADETMAWLAAEQRRHGSDGTRGT